MPFENSEGIFASGWSKLKIVHESKANDDCNAIMKDYFCPEVFLLRGVFDLAICGVFIFPIHNFKKIIVYKLLQ